MEQMAQQILLTHLPYAHTLSKVGNAQISTAQSKFGGSSLYLDGSGSYLTSSSPSDYYMGSANFTIDAWVYLNAMPTTDNWPGEWYNNEVVAGIGTPSAGDGLDLVIGKTKIFMMTNDPIIVSGNHGMTTHTWYHVAGVRSGNTLYVFVDGHLVGSAPYSGNVGNGSGFYVGSETGQGAWFNGYIDELRVTKGEARWISDFTPPTSAIDSGNILKIGNIFGSATFIGDTSSDYGVIEKFNLSNSGSGTSLDLQFNGNLNDSSPFSNPVTAHGNPTILNGVGFFGGSPNYLSIPYASNFDLSGGADFTMDAWFKSNSFATNQAIISNDTNGWNFDWDIGINDATHISIYTQGTAQTLTAQVPQMQVDTWYHVAVVRHSGTNTIYLNGVPYNSNTMAFSNSSQTAVTIGAYSWNNPNNFFNGSLDDIRIVKGTALWTTNFNQFFGSGKFTFSGSLPEVFDNSGAVTRFYISDASTSRHFAGDTPDGGISNWSIIAKGAVVDITSAIYDTATNIFKALIDPVTKIVGKFISNGLPASVVPNITIATTTIPYVDGNISTHTLKWRPSINWDSAEHCFYSYDDFQTVIDANCSNNDTSLASVRPTPGLHTLYLMGVDHNGGTTQTSITYYYDNTSPVWTSCGSDLLDESTRQYYYLAENVNGNCTATVDTTLQGSLSTSTPSFTLTGNINTGGYDITLKNITVTGTTTASGVTDRSNGGNIVVENSITGALVSSGVDDGNILIGMAGSYAGKITSGLLTSATNFSNYSFDQSNNYTKPNYVFGKALAFGGTNSSGFGGNGGDITVGTSTTAAIISDGGAGATTGGTGGTVTVDNSQGIVAGTIVQAKGGNTTCGTGGNGGNISLNNFLNYVVVNDAGIPISNSCGGTGSQGHTGQVQKTNDLALNNNANTNNPVDTTNGNKSGSVSGVAPITKYNPLSQPVEIPVQRLTPLDLKTLPSFGDSNDKGTFSFENSIMNFLSTPTPTIPKEKIKLQTTQSQNSSSIGRGLYDVFIYTLLNLGDILQAKLPIPYSPELDLPLQARIVLTDIKPVASVVTPVAVVAGFTQIIFALVQDGFSLARLVTSLLSLLGLRKKRQPWGVVYDSVTKEPLDPAYLVIKDKDGNDITESISDLNGRYGFLTTSGTYKIEANKSNYIFPSKKLEGKIEDELYNNLYFGELFTSDPTNPVITKNIPMDPIDFDWNQFAKLERKEINFSLADPIIARITNAFFALGFLSSVAILLIAPTILNGLVVFLYIFFGLLQTFGVRVKTFGRLVDSQTGKPLPFAIVRAIYSQINQEIGHVVADKFGRYYSLVPKGEYDVRVDKKNPDESYTSVFVGRNLKENDGIINENFEV
ncbi:MAG: LamG domain-containing protein [bacterium]